MKKILKDKIPAVVFAAALAAVVGVMSWQDMHPPRHAHQGREAMTPSYYAGIEAAPATVPDDDSLPVTIAQGKIIYGPQGKARLVHQGMQPVTFAQRQLNLLLRLDALPKSAAETVEKIKSLIAEWQVQGNTVSVIFLDYRPEKIDFKAYDGFIRALRQALRQEPHEFVPVADPAWPRERLLLKADIPFFLVDLRSVKIAPDLLQKLGDFGADFQLRFPAGTMPGDVDVPPLLKIDSFTGSMFTLDPRKPWPKKEEHIGLFPKFF